MTQIWNKKRAMLLIMSSLVMFVVAACSPAEKHEYNPDSLIAEAQETAAIVLSSAGEATEKPAEVVSEEATEEPTEEVATEEAEQEATEEVSEEATQETSADASSVEVSFDPEAAARGEMLFVTCSACHGLDARGIMGLGKTLIESEFVDSLSDEELVAFITVGRPVFDAANTTGIDMPAKGGNPAFTEDDLYDIVAYIRSLQP